MKRILFIALVTALMAPVGLMAQKVYKDSQGRVILDMTETGEGIGMPAAAVTNTSKTALYASFTPSNTTMGTISGSSNNQGNAINVAVYEKLEIATQDEASGLSWDVAFNTCKSLTGGGWRLPTQRELMLIYVMKPAIESFPGMTAFHNTPLCFYYSATEAVGTTIFALLMPEGAMLTTNKASVAGRARCVREVTP